MPRARIVASILSVSIAFALAGCGVQQPMPTPTPTATPVAPSGDGVLRIATVLSSADPLSAARVAGVDVAVREINEAGGWGGAPVHVVHRNAGEDAVAAVAGLASLGIDLIIGGSTSEQFDAMTTTASDVGSAVLSPTMFGPDGGVDLSEAAIAQLRGSDPGLTDFSGAAGARDAVIAAALAATVAQDEAGASIESQLPAVLDGEAPCTAYVECIDALDSGYSIAFAGWSSPVR